MFSSKIRRKSSVVAYSPALVMRFCSRMVTSFFLLTSRFRSLEIDKKHRPSCFQPLFSDRVRFASTSPGKSLEHVSSKNAGTGKPGALLHQVDDRVFSLPADNGQAAQVDHQLASFQIALCVSASGAKLSYPRTAELSF